MALRYGKYGSYNQTVGVRLDMDDAIQILSPSDVPLQGRLRTDTTNQVKVEWLEEDLTAQSVTIQTSGVSGTASPWTITVDDSSVLRPGDVLWNQTVGTSSRQFTVTSINTGANTAVIASFAGTDDTMDPADGDVLVIVGQYRVEGSDPEEARSVERTSKYNYTQWGQERVEATRTARKRGLYGQGDPYDHEVQKKFKELAIRFERSLVHGQRAISSDSKSRMMGGLLYFIATNTASNTKANASTAINTLVKACYEAGGNPSTLMVSPSVKAAISANTPVGLRTERADNTAGTVVDRIMTDFGEVNLVVNRFFPKTKGILLQEEFLSRVNFDPYFHELLAKTGDADKGHIVGEFSLRVKNEKAHGILTLTDA